MKILQINTVSGVGSTGRIATDLHSILLSQGHSSTVAYSRYAAINCDHTIRIGNRVDNYLHVAQTRLFDKHGFASASATKELIAQIIEINPDLIHLHNVHGYYLHIGLLFDYLKQANKPVIWTLHDCWTFTGHCAHFDFEGCNKWMTECHQCPLTREYPKSLFYDRSQLNFRQKKELFTGVSHLTIVTPSKWLSALVKKSFLQEYPVAVVNNGIDLQMFKPTPSDFRCRYNLNDKYMILGVASHWTDRKGLQYFIELAGKLHADEKIVLVGVTEKQIKKLPQEIICIAKTNNTRELAEIYSAADIYLNFTLEDNFPTTNIEAIACGIPVVTFDSGGSSESLDEGCGIARSEEHT